MRLMDKIREENEKGYGVHMPHVYMGDPNIEFTEKIVKTMANNGGDILEVGIPFSDPVADGPTFQEVCQRALENGTTPHDCLDLIKRLRVKGFETPIVLTTYFNIPFNMGLKNFLKNISEAGVQGIIIPNLPLEEADLLLDATRNYEINVILQVAPTTTDARLKKIVDVATGFIYAINVEGVTGARNSIEKPTLDLIKRVKSFSDLPVLAGFGVSEARHAQILSKCGANGVIAGSVYANIYQKYSEPVNSLDSIAEKVKEIKSGCLL